MSITRSELKRALGPDFFDVCLKDSEQIRQEEWAEATGEVAVVPPCPPVDLELILAVAIGRLRDSIDVLTRWKP